MRGSVAPKVWDAVARRQPGGADGCERAGPAFGDAGFYFTVHAGDGGGWARYVRTLRETIDVYVDDQGLTRADHTLQIWGLTFLRLHYRLSCGPDLEVDRPALRHLDASSGGRP